MYVTLLWQARRPVSRRHHVEAQSPILTPILLLHTAHIWTPSDQPFDIHQAVRLARYMTAVFQSFTLTIFSATRMTSLVTLMLRALRRSAHRQRRRRGPRRSYRQARFRSAVRPPSSMSSGLPSGPRLASRPESTVCCVIPTIYQSAGACRIGVGREERGRRIEVEKEEVESS